MSTDQSSTFTTLGDVCVVWPYADLLATHGLTSLDALMEYQASDRLDKPGLPRWRERIRVVVPGGDGQPVTLYLKRYRSPPLRAQGGRVLRGSACHGTAWVEWYWMGRLAADGVRAVKPVAFAERMRGGREMASVVVTEAVSGESLEKWAGGRSERCPRLLIESLARFVRRFHTLGYVHRDLYLSHIFYNVDTDPSNQFCLIDLQRVMRPVWRHGRWVVKDLAALNYSTPRNTATMTDRVRFLRFYLGVRRLGPVGKRLTRRVAAKTGRIARHDQRRQAKYAPAAALSEERSR